MCIKDSRHSHQRRRKELHLIPHDTIGGLIFTSIEAVFHIREQKKSAGARTGEKGGWLISTTPGIVMKSFTV
jgi:hypothetical protein